MRNLREPVYLICKEDFDKIVESLKVCTESTDLEMARACAFWALKGLTEFEIEEDCEE